MLEARIFYFTSKCSYEHRVILGCTNETESSLDTNFRCIGHESIIDGDILWKKEMREQWKSMIKHAATNKPKCNLKSRWAKGTWMCVWM